MAPDLRYNFDYVFLANDKITSSQKKLYDYWADMFPTFNEFCDIFMKYTKNYNNLVICYRGECNAINEKVFYFNIDEYNQNNPNNQNICYL